MDALKPLLVIGSAALALDAVWLTYRYDYHRALFQQVQQSPLMMRLLPAIGVYLLLPIIVYLVAVEPAADFAAAVRRGALTGLLLYGFYDLTNYATLSGWTLHMTVTDTLWGGAVCAAAAAAGYYYLKGK
jgi:uncharacterized membrane protein